MVLEIICVAIGVLGITYGIRCYYELWKWSSICKNVRIAIAYKNKVKIDAPLLEWILWTNLLDKDKDSKGRVVYMQGATRVALVKRYFGEWTWRKWVIAIAAQFYATFKRRNSPKGEPPVREGTYKTTDQTPQENKGVKV